MPIVPKLAALAQTQGGAFTAAQALSVGYDVDEISRLRRSGAWLRLRRGVYAERALVPDDAEARHVLRLHAALLCLKGPLAASHVTAAVLHGIALLDADLSLVHITREHAGSSRTGDGVRHHNASLPAGQLTKIDDILTTAVARTIVDFARATSFEIALVSAESALNRNLTTLPELREVMEYCVDWPGARNASRVVAFASPYSESPGETLGRIAFDSLGVPLPDQQVLIFDDAGFVARCDYFWEDRHTVGEFDGKLKYVGDKADDAALYKEKRREDRAREGGLEVFRIGWAETRAKSPSVRQKAFAAFDRAAHSTGKRTYRFTRQPPPG